MQTHFKNLAQKCVTAGNRDSFIENYIRNVRQDSLIKFLRCQFVPSKPDREPFSELINQLWPLSGGGGKTCFGSMAPNIGFIFLRDSSTICVIVCRIDVAQYAKKSL